jgi:signal transduction histidine kinase
VVYAIEEDAAGRLWLSTNQGLVRFDAASGAVESFDLTNGLHSLQFRFGAGLRTRAGRLLFGSSDGFYDFNPEALTPDSHAPPLVLTALRVFNEAVKLPQALSTLERLTLSHRDKVFSLEFAALDRTLPRRNRYAYRMEGLSEQWIQLGGKREVTFTNLDPGRYVFQVKASNSDGVWSEAPGAGLEIVVAPPFWRTAWFRVLSGALLAGVLLAAHVARVRHLKADMALRESLRRSETMSAMGSLVAGVAHEVRNPLFSISANLDLLDTELKRQQPCGETLAIIDSEVRRLRELMEELLEYGRPFSLQCTREPLTEVLAEAAEACGLLARRRDVTLANDISPQLPLATVDRRRLAQVFQNLLENAIQHSPPGSRICASGREVWRDGRLWVECAIVDSGPGFQPQDLPRLFEPFFTKRHGGTGLGLSIVQRIVAAHGGAVAAQNREEGGARMIVSLPADGNGLPA